MRQLLFYLCLLCVAVSHGEPATLENVVVAAGSLEHSLPEKIAASGSELVIIDSDAIRLSGAQDAAKALQMLAPGLYVAPKNGAFDYASVSLQGSRSGDILWLVDGVRINNRLYAGTSPLDTIPAAAIERIEILKGGQSLFYGTQAIAGAVNIVTHSVQPGAVSEVQLGLHSDAGRSRSGRLVGGNEQTRYLLFASNDQTQGFRAFKRQHREPSASDTKRGYDVSVMGGKLVHQLSQHWRLSALYQQHNAELDYLRPTDNFLTQNQRTEDMAYIKLDGRIRDNISLYVKGYFHQWDTRYLRIYNAGAGLALKSNYDYWGYTDRGINLMAEVADVAGLDVRLGYDMQNFSGSDDVLKIASQQEQVEAVFLQLASRESLWSDAQFSLGGRYNKPAGEGDSWVGHASGTLNLAEQVQLFAALGSSFRLPSAYELYASDDCCTQGNPDLAPEVGKNLNVGARYQDAYRQFGLTLFTRQVNRLIGSASDDNGGKHFVNSGRSVLFRGVELDIALDLTRYLSFTLNHVYSRAVAKGETQQINNIPLNNSKAGLAWKPQQGLQLMLNVNRVGSVSDEENNRRINYGNYTLVDLSVRHFLDVQQRQDITLSLENLTDQQYATSVASARRDADNSAYVYENLGTPWLAKLSYRMRF